jgi:hypothetical protein
LSNSSVARSLLPKTCPAWLEAPTRSDRRSPVRWRCALSTYEGLGRQADGTRGPVHRRDDAASDQVSHVYIAPAVLKLGGPSPLNVEEEAMLLSEVDRQICFAGSNRSQKKSWR